MIKRFLILLWIACSVQAVDRYVEPVAGVDSGSGTIGSPWKTISYGIANMDGGDTLWLRGGTHTSAGTGNGTTMIKSGPSATQFTSIRGYPGELALWKPTSTAYLLAIGWAFNVRSNVWIGDFAIDGSDRLTSANPFIAAVAARNVVITNMMMTNSSGLAAIAAGPNTSHAGIDSDFIIEDNVVDGWGMWRPEDVEPHAFYVRAFHGLVLRGNRLYNNYPLARAGSRGIHMYDDAHGYPFPRSTNAIVENNCIEVKDGAAVFGMQYGLVVRNNVFKVLGTSPSRDCVAIGYGLSVNEQFYNNTFYGGRYGISITQPSTPSITTPRFANNIIWGSVNNPIQINDTNTVSYWTNNIARQAINGNGAGNAVLQGNLFSASYDPLFTAAPSNLTVQPSSPSVDAGVNLASLFSTDFAGDSRPYGVAFDIGAYERQPVTYYVRKDGSDASTVSGRSDSAAGAWLTIGKATGQVKAGDTVNVRQGTYQENAILTIPGASGYPITWTGEKSGTNFLTIIDPSVIITPGSWVLDTEYGAAGVYKLANVQAVCGFQPGGVIVDDYWCMEHREKRWRKTLFNADNYTLAFNTSGPLWTGPFTITESGYPLPGGGVNYGRFMGPIYTNTFAWDGIGAAWFLTNNTVYLKIRDGSNPNSRQVRFSDNGDDTNPNKVQTGTTLHNQIYRKAPLMVHAGYNTVENFHIRGGANASVAVAQGPAGSPTSIAGVIINTNLVQHGARQVVATGGTSFPISDLHITRNNMDPKQAWSMFHGVGAYSYLTSAHSTHRPHMTNSWKHWMVYWASKYLNYYDPGTNVLTVTSGSVSVTSGSTNINVTSGTFRFVSGMSVSSQHKYGMLVFPAYPTYRPRILDIENGGVTAEVDIPAPSAISAAAGQWQIHTYATASGIEAGHLRLQTVRSGNKVVWNTMSNGGGAVGMDCTSTINSQLNITGNVIASNLMENISAQALWIRPHGMREIYVFENDIRNASMFVRFQDVNLNSTNPLYETPVVYFYRNRGWNPQFHGSVTYVHLNTVLSNTNYWDLRFYNNSYEGGDMGGFDFAATSNPARAAIHSKMKILNNIFGIGRLDSNPDGATASIFNSWTTASLVEKYDYNLLSAMPPLSSTGTPSPKDGGHNQLNSRPYEWGGVFSSDIVPSFQISPTSQAYNAGTNLVGLGWPDTRSLAGGLWDIGASEWTTNTTTTNEFRIAVLPADDPSERARIQDDDYAPPTVPAVLFSVHRQDLNTTGDAYFELDFATAPGSAAVTEGVDYTLAPWTYMIPDGMSWTNVESIHPIRNTNYFGQRLLRVSVRPSQDYTIGSPSFGDILVEEADEPPAGGTNMLYLTIGQALRDGDYPTSPASIFSVHRIKFEGGAWVPKIDGNQDFEFSLSSPNGVAQDVDYTITNFTGTIASGDWWTNVLIYPKRNTLYTGPRTLTVALEPGTYFIDPNSGTGDFDVEDIDAPSGTSVVTYFTPQDIGFTRYLSESGQPIELQITRYSTDVSAALSGTWTWYGDLVVNTDYTVDDGNGATTDDHLNWTIPAGLSGIRYDVTAIPDGIYTGPKDGYVVVNPGSGYTVSSGPTHFIWVDAEQPSAVEAGPDRPGQFIPPHAPP